MQGEHFPSHRVKGGLCVTYSNSNAENRLAEKLRSEYRNRGAALKGMEATPTSELMARAQMGRDPRVNVSAQAFDDRLRRRQESNGRVEYAQRSGAPRSSSSAPPRPSSPYARTDTRTASAGASATGIRNGTSAARGQKNGKGYGSASANGYRPQAAYAEKKARRVEINDDEDVFEEIKVERRKMPWSFLVVLAVSTVMIMLVILSVAQIYESTQEVSGLKYTISELKDTIDDLELKIDEKNDIRLIEQKATKELGMVKEDSLQKKYISLSDGERVDLVENTDEADAMGGTMLSSIFSALSDFFDYFK